MTTAKTEAIRALNDQLRANLKVGGGEWFKQVEMKYERTAAPAAR